MEVKTFTHPREFYPIVQDFLLQREAEHNLLFGILSEISVNLFQYGNEQPYLALVEDQGQILGVALRTPPHNLILSHFENLSALAALIGDVSKTFPILAGLSARVELAPHFLEAWKGISGQPYERVMAQRIYQLDQVKSPSTIIGKMRRVNDHDRELVTDWLHNFMLDTGNVVTRERAEQTAKRYFESDSSLRGLYVWEVDGQAVSMAGYAGPTPHGIRIGAVYTPPELRRRGYASMIVATLSQLILDGGRKFCFLYTDLSNPTSNHIYQEIGYYPVCDVDEYRFE